MSNYQEMLYKYIGYAEKESCSPEENEKLAELVQGGKPLPEGYETDKDYPDKFFYQIKKFDLSREEIQDLIGIKKARDIRTIKKCAVFFSVALACQLAAVLILLIVTLSAAG